MCKLIYLFYDVVRISANKKKHDCESVCGEFKHTNMEPIT